MPLKFWKKEKPEKGKEEEPEEGEEEAPVAPPKGEAPAPEPEARKPAPPTAAAKPPTQEPEAVKPELKKPEARPGPPAAGAKPGELESVVSDVHAGLVDLGLTVPPTKTVFAKRIFAYPGGEAAFAAEYQSKPYRAVTRSLGDWLGFRVPDPFDLDKLLADVNLRLSSFKLNVAAKDPTWIDQELNLRKAKVVLGDQEKIVRFKDARDLLKGVNELLAPRKLAFLELETWADDFVFLLVREPRWDRLATTELVVVKAAQTAKGGECRECGAPIGKYWNSCLKCGAVFG